MKRIEYVGDDPIEVGLHRGELHAADAGEMEKVVDERLHARREPGQRLESVAAGLVQPVVIVLQQEGGVIVDAAQRLLEVV